MIINISRRLYLTSYKVVNNSEACEKNNCEYSTQLTIIHDPTLINRLAESLLEYIGTIFEEIYKRNEINHKNGSMI